MYDGDILTIDATPRNPDSVLRIYGFAFEAVYARRWRASLDFLFGTDRYTGQDVRAVPRSVCPEVERGMTRTNTAGRSP